MAYGGVKYGSTNIQQLHHIKLGTDRGKLFLLLLTDVRMSGLVINNCQHRLCCMEGIKSTPSLK